MTEAKRHIANSQAPIWSGLKRKTPSGQNLFGDRKKLLTFKELINWTRSNDNAKINHSETAIYQTSIAMAPLPEGDNIYLNLGMIKDMAKVTVNGKNVGSAWTASCKVDGSHWTVNILNCEGILTFKLTLYFTNIFPVAKPLFFILFKKSFVARPTYVLQFLIALSPLSASSHNTKYSLKQLFKIG